MLWVTLQAVADGPTVASAREHLAAETLDSSDSGSST